MCLYVMKHCSELLPQGLVCKSGAVMLFLWLALNITRRFGNEMAEDKELGLVALHGTRVERVCMLQCPDTTYRQTAAEINRYPLVL